MNYSQGTWQKDSPTPGQLNYIGMMIKSNPQLPPFTGKTKGDAAIYIEKYKKRKAVQQNEDH